LASGLPAVLDRAREAGLVAMICAAANIEESRAALSLANKHADVYCLAGVHPHDAADAQCYGFTVPPEPDAGAAADVASEPSLDVRPGFLIEIERLAADPRNVAIVEIGLDYHYNFSPPEVQRQVFASQLELAMKHGKMVVIHTREAFEDTLAIIRNSGLDGERIIFHSFTEGPAAARTVLDLGSAISFSGIVTFKNSPAVRESAALVPADRILIETDAPYLSPEPVRNMKTNEPANVAHVLACLAEVRNVPAEELADMTTRNAIRLFGLP
jgi:TatD DNase family protein